MRSSVDVRAQRKGSGASAQTLANVYYNWFGDESGSPTSSKPNGNIESGNLSAQTVSRRPSQGTERTSPRGVAACGVARTSCALDTNPVGAKIAVVGNASGKKSTGRSLLAMLAVPPLSKTPPSVTIAHSSSSSSSSVGRTSDRRDALASARPPKHAADPTLRIGNSLNRPRASTFCLSSSPSSSPSPSPSPSPSSYLSRKAREDRSGSVEPSVREAATRRKSALSVEFSLARKPVSAPDMPISGLVCAGGRADKPRTSNMSLLAGARTIPGTRDSTSRVKTENAGRGTSGTEQEHVEEEEEEDAGATSADPQGGEEGGTEAEATKAPWKGNQFGLPQKMRVGTGDAKSNGFCLPKMKRDDKCKSEWSLPKGAAGRGREGGGGGGGGGGSKSAMFAGVRLMKDVRAEAAVKAAEARKLKAEQDAIVSAQVRAEQLLENALMQLEDEARARLAEDIRVAENRPARYDVREFGMFRARFRGARSALRESRKRARSAEQAQPAIGDRDVREPQGEVEELHNVAHETRLSKRRRRLYHPPSFDALPDVQQAFLRRNIIVSDARRLEISNYEQGSDEWRKAREGRIGGSTYSAALGNSIYTSPDELVQEMICCTFFGNADTKRGQELEPLARDKLLRLERAKFIRRLRRARARGRAYVEYAYQRFDIPNDVDERTEAQLFDIVEKGAYIHPTKPWLSSSSDGDVYVFGVKVGIIEIKSPRRDRYPLLPPYYWDQLQGNMHMHGVKFCIFVCYIETDAPGDLINDYYAYDQAYCELFLEPMLHQFFFERYLPRASVETESVGDGSSSSGRSSSSSSGRTPGAQPPPLRKASTSMSAFFATSAERAQKRETLAKSPAGASQRAAAKKTPKLVLPRKGTARGRTPSVAATQRSKPSFVGSYYNTSSMESGSLPVFV